MLERFLCKRPEKKRTQVSLSGFNTNAMLGKLRASVEAAHRVLLDYTICPSYVLLQTSSRTPHHASIPSLTFKAIDCERELLKIAVGQEIRSPASGVGELRGVEGGQANVMVGRTCSGSPVVVALDSMVYALDYSSRLRITCLLSSLCPRDARLSHFFVEFDVEKT